MLIYWNFKLMFSSLHMIQLYTLRQTWAPWYWRQQAPLFIIYTINRFVTYEGSSIVDNFKNLLRESNVDVCDPKPILSNWQRAELLDNFHKEHGNFEDVKEYVQNEEQNDNTLWQQVNKSKKKLTSQEEYHRRSEQRIEQLMLKVDNGESSLEDLTAEDRQVIIDINNQNKV